MSRTRLNCDRLKALGEIIIPVPEDLEALVTLTNALDALERGEKAKGFSIIGDTQAGKTTTRDKLIRELLQRDYLPTHKDILAGSRIHNEIIALSGEPVVGRDERGKARKRFAAFDTTSSGHAKPYLDDFLGALGEVVLSRSTIGSNEKRIVNIINANNVGVVFIDEFHHVVFDKQAKKIWQISEIIKIIQNGTNALFVFLGTQEVKALHQQNRQFQARNPTIIVLKPYDWLDEKSRSQYRRFIYEIDLRLGFDHLSDLDEEYTAFRIYQATSGSKGQTFDLIVDAARIAIQQDADGISVAHLGAAYRRTYASSRESHIDPFTETPPREWRPVAAGYWQRSRATGS